MTQSFVCFEKKIIPSFFSLQSVCSPSVQLQMDKAIPPLPALVGLEIIGNFKHDFQEIVSYRMLLEIISLKKAVHILETQSMILVVLLSLYTIEKQVSR